MSTVGNVDVESASVRLEVREIELGRGVRRRAERIDLREEVAADAVRVDELVDAALELGGEERVERDPRRWRAAREVRVAHAVAVGGRAAVAVLLGLRVTRSRRNWGRAGERGRAVQRRRRSVPGRARPRCKRARGPRSAVIEERPPHVRNGLWVLHVLRVDKSST